MLTFESGFYPTSFTHGCESSKRTSFAQEKKFEEVNIRGKLRLTGKRWEINVEVKIRGR